MIPPKSKRMMSGRARERKIIGRSRSAPNAILTQRVRPKSQSAWKSSANLTLISRGDGSAVRAATEVTRPTLTVCCPAASLERCPKARAAEPHVAATARWTAAARRPMGPRVVTVVHEHRTRPGTTVRVRARGHAGQAHRPSSQDDAARRRLPEFPKSASARRFDRGSLRRRETSANAPRNSPMTISAARVSAIRRI